MAFQARLLRLDKGDTLAPAALDMLLGSQMSGDFDIGGTITQVWVENDWVMIEVDYFDKYEYLMETDFEGSVNDVDTR